MSQPTTSAPRLDYANPSAEDFPANFAQQTAKVAWLAPIAAIAIALLSRGTRDNHFLTVVLASINMALLLLGLGATVVALLGMKRWGRERVLLPASAGFCICMIAGATVLSLLTAPRVAAGSAISSISPAVAAAPASARQPSDAELEQQGRDAALKSGWLGAAVDRLVITLLTLPDDAPFVKDMVADLPTRASVACFVFDNSAGATAVNIDTGGAVLTHLDGRQEPLPDPANVLRTARDRSLENVFMPTFNVRPRTKMANKMLFLPRDIDARDVRSISIKVDGRVIEIPGRYFTAEQKAALYKQRP